ncbi:DUF928 domain-containing protein [[Phormidium] sp. ETS-05]|uniref:DUF928 domain-containing protein n=1 Tax=[Phormidium] sp. ETS-05 TaxID=222819 RepID=UPI0018EF1A29|nr:DUF928 domain-containing protein [[Phormidium] sp. ETS-05]
MPWKQLRRVSITMGWALLLPLLVWEGLPVQAVEFTPPDVGPPGRRIGGGTRAAQPLPTGAQATPGIFESSDPEPPGRRIGGATRGPDAEKRMCLQDDDRSRRNLPPAPTSETVSPDMEKRLLTVLLPDQDTKLGLTVEAHPTFFWYVPNTSARQVEFLLMDETDVIYETQVNISGNAGIVSLTLPETAPALTESKYYRWYVFMVCDPTDRGSDAYTGGWVQRVQPNQELAAQLKAAQGKELVLAYAKAGIWHETVASLLQLRQSNPENEGLVNDWVELLGSVNLKSFAEAPLILPEENPSESSSPPNIEFQPPGTTEPEGVNPGTTR